MNAKRKAWIGALRLRTLPLALSGMGMGAFMAAGVQQFKWDIFLLSLLTTALLQILSNLANDYGDYMNGADLTGRQGPVRATQSGVISPKEMKKAVITVALLAFVSGLALLFVSFYQQAITLFGLFLLLGIVAIGAALKYTAGSNPYGYMGLGDISVFIFFGWVAVVGSYFLYTKSFHTCVYLPAAALGFFSTGVLNINNIRDIVSDREAGKITIPVRLGPQLARIYHVFLLLAGLLCIGIHTWIYFRHPWQLLYAIPGLLIIFNALKVYRTQEAARVDPFLKQLALSTLLFSLLWGIGWLLSINA